MTEPFASVDDTEERGIIRPWLLAIVLVTAGLTLWAFDGKLDDGSPTTATVISSSSSR
jgi:hypothetical protein